MHSGLPALTLIGCAPDRSTPYLRLRDEEIVACKGNPDLLGEVRCVRFFDTICKFWEVRAEHFRTYGDRI